MKTLHRSIGLCLVLTSVVLLGCTPGHFHKPVLEQGQLLDVVVNVPSKKAADASGTVYFRLPADASGYESMPMVQRGSDLYATLQTQDLKPGQAVAYYFDVYAGGEARLIGTPQNPYYTEIVDFAELVRRSAYYEVLHAEAGDPVVFKVGSKRYPVTRAVIRYSPPDLNGFTEQVMTPIENEWIAEVPGNRVTPGSWSFRIEAEIAGIQYSFPQSNGDPGFFKVEPRKKQKP